MIPVEWLAERLNETDPENVARRDLCQLGLGPAEQAQLLAGAGFAKWRHKWTAFLRQMVPGDELWYFTSPPEQWQSLAGAAGYAIVRNGVPVAVLNARRS